MANPQLTQAAIAIENAIARLLDFAAGTGDKAFIERIMKLAIKKEIVLELLVGELGGLSPAYGNFWSTLGFETIPFNTPVPFNHTGPTAGGVTLLNPTTIFVPQGGDYSVTYTVTVNIASAHNTEAVFALFLNNSATPIPNAQTTFGINGDNEDTCLQVHGEALLTLPDNSTLQLKNSDFGQGNVVTCDSRVNDAAINLVKLN